MSEKLFNYFRIFSFINYCFNYCFFFFSVYFISQSGDNTAQEREIGIFSPLLFFFQENQKTSILKHFYFLQIDAQNQQHTFNVIDDKSLEETQFLVSYNPQHPQFPVSQNMGN